MNDVRCEQKGRKLMPPSLAAPTSHSSHVLLPLLHTHMDALTQVRDEWWFQTAVYQRCSDKKLFVVYFRSSSSSFLYPTFSFIPTLHRTYTLHSNIKDDTLLQRGVVRCSISLSTPFYHKTIMHNGWITAVYVWCFGIRRKQDGYINFIMNIDGCVRCSPIIYEVIIIGYINRSWVCYRFQCNAPLHVFVDCYRWRSLDVYNVAHSTQLTPLSPWVPSTWTSFHSNVFSSSSLGVCSV